MTDQEKSTTEIPFDVSSCLTMMEKMMGEHGAACDCAAMMSQAIGQEEIPEEWSKVMSQMMEICCGPQDEEKAST